MSKDLKDICMEFMDVEEGLMYGTIDFKYDRLMAAMKAGHPAMIMDSLMFPVFIPAINDIAVDINSVKKMYTDLTDFAGEFGVKELKKPLKHLKEYIIEKVGDSSFFGNDAFSRVTLKDIRKKYVGKIIDLNKLSGDVWNKRNKDGIIEFHYYFNNFDDARGTTGRFMDHVEMRCDENNVVTHIEPLYCEREASSGIRRSSFESTRATTMHYEEFDKVLKDAFGSDKND